MTFIDEARRRQPDLPYNGKKRALIERLPGFLEALRDPTIDARTITDLLETKGYRLPYRTVWEWCSEERA